MRRLSGSSSKPNSNLCREVRVLAEALRGAAECQVAAVAVAVLVGTGAWHSLYHPAVAEVLAVVVALLPLHRGWPPVAEVMEVVVALLLRQVHHPELRPLLAQARPLAYSQRDLQ